MKGGFSGKGASPPSRLLALGVALLALVAADAHPAGGESCPGCVRAGAASVEIRVPPGTPLAGYGSLSRRLPVPDLFDRHRHAFWFRPAQGQLDSLWARAVVIESGGRRLTWVTADLIAVGRRLTAELVRRLEAGGVAPGTVILSASHTHSGPGAFLDAGILGPIAVDRKDREVQDAVLDGLVEAVRRAEAALLPGRIGVASGRVPGLTTGRLGDPVDPDLTVIKILTQRGAPVAILWNYAIHGTALGPGNLYLSADVMGEASRQIERDLGVPALFVNGAVGDVSPARHGLAAVREAGHVLAAAAAAAWARAPTAPRATLRLRALRVALPDPHLRVGNCTTGWAPRWLRVPLDGALPADAELIAGALGDTAWVTVPGELQFRLGEAIRRAAMPPWARVFVAGLSNDYLGYFLAPAAYERTTYVACASLYGPGAGETLQRSAGDLLQALGQDRR